LTNDSIYISVVDANFPIDAILYGTAFPFLCRSTRRIVQTDTNDHIFLLCQMLGKRIVKFSILVICIVFRYSLAIIGELSVNVYGVVSLLIFSCFICLNLALKFRILSGFKCDENKIRVITHDNVGASMLLRLGDTELS
jgi:hypothetical protein